ncbi:pneumococcal serine-rich repeat protein-like [Chironomus tepperi]|uniref:pneumococcal serine-rich repeat protein-like n=1 Tax=Chironomus tepperi TaxID=113505 RepID=UPI00391EE3DA
MNKVILSAFVLLLVAQGIESQFPILNFIGTLIVNLITLPLALTSSFVSTVAYNVLSFTGFSLNWQFSQSDFLIYVKPPVVINPSTISTSTIQLVSPSLKSLITTINTTVHGIDANVASFTSTLNNKSYSNCGRTLASLAVNLYDQAPRRLGYSMMSIATVMGGRRPNQSPFGLTPYDPVYPVPSTILPRDTDNFRANVGVHAKNFILYLPYLFKDLNDAATTIQNLRAQISGGCVCPSSSSVPNLITQWTNLNSSIAGFTTSTVTTKTLVQVLTSTLLTNVTATFNATYLWMNSVLSCTQCLVGSLKNNGSRCVKAYCNSKPLNDSTSAGFNDTSCIASGLRAIGRFRHNLQHDYALARNVELRAQSFLLSRVNRYVNDHSGFVIKGILNINTNTGLLRNSIFKTRMKTFKTHMDGFQLNIQASYNTLGLNINNSIAAFNSYIDTAIQNSTAAVSSSALTFAETVINSSSLYPCCQQYAGQALDIQDKLQSDVKSCMQNTATAVNNIAASMTTDLTSHGKNFNRFTSTVDSCVNTYCKGWPCVNAFLLVPSFDTHVSNCVTAVNTGLTGYNPNVFAIGNASIASVAANIASANVTFNQCINVAVSNAQQRLSTVQSQYSTCKKVGTCTNGTTDMRPTLVPIIDLIVTNLTAILNLKGNTSIDPACLSAVIADAQFLMDQTKAVSSSLMSQSYETEEKVLNFILTSTAAVNYNLSLCKSDNRTILLPRIAQAITDLSNLWNLTMNVTGLDPYCLNMSQQNISGVMDMALSLQTQLNATDYHVDFASVDALPSIVEQLRAEFNVCMNTPYDNRTALIPNINQVILNIQALINITLNSSMDSSCAGPLLSNLTSILAVAESIPISIFNFAYDVDVQIITGMENITIELQNELAACQAFDNRTLLLPSINQVINDINSLLNLTLSATGDPACFASLTANMTAVMNLTVDLQTSLTDYTYDIGLSVVSQLQLIASEFQAAYNVCLVYDNRTALIPNITQVILDLQTMINITLSSSMDSSCAGLLLSNLTSVMAIAKTMPTLIFNFTYDLDVQIVAGAQNLTIELQKELAACQAFDNRTLLLPSINQVINNINVLLNLISSSTADPGCLASLTANMTAVMNATLSLQASLTEYTYDIGLSIVSELQLVTAGFEAAYNACLTYDNRTVLAANVNNILTAVTNLTNLLASSTASAYCLGPLQQNASILTNVSIMIQTDIYNYTYDIGLAIVTEMQSYLAQLQSAYAACLLFDNRTLLQPEIIADSANLNAFANILMTSTANPYCLGPIQQNLSNLLTLQLAIESGLFNSSYAADLTLMVNFDVSFAQLQAAYNACLVFDNRTLLVPTVNSLVANLTALAAIVANSTASSYCLLPLQYNMSILMSISSTISTDIFNYTYDIGAAIISGYQLALLQAQAAYDACLTFDNRTLLEVELTGDLANLTIFGNILSSSTADPYCLGPIQQNFSLLMSVAAAIQSGLYNSTYYMDMISLIDLDTAFANIQASYAACLVFDNRTLLTPSVTTVLNDLATLNSIFANSTASSYCLGPLQANLSVLITASGSLQTDIFNYTYDIGAAIIAGFQVSIAEAQAAYNACLTFDNRTLLQEELTGDLTNLTILANLIMSSTAAPYCLDPIKQNLSVIQTLSQALQSGLFSSTYNEDLANMINLDKLVAQLQAAYDACLLFDNRTLLVAELPSVITNLTTLINQVTSAIADPACLGPLQANLTLMINISQSLQIELFNYTYDIGLAIIGSLQMSIADAQAGLATCLADPRIPLLSIISGAAANASVLNNLLANSTASSYCLVPLQQNVSLLLNISQSFQQDFYSYDYTIGSTILSSLQSSLADAQAAYEACLLFDNRTLLETELTGDMANLTTLVNTIMSSSADPYCLTAIQQNASAILALAQAIQAGLFGNSYFQDWVNMQSMDVAVAQLEAAYNACLLFDNRTLLVPTVAALQANLTILAGLAANSTADQYCLGPLQYNLTLLLSMTANLQIDIFNYSYDIATAILNDFQLSLALEQANYIDCLAFDNRTLLQPNVTATLNDLTTLSNTIMASTADPYCLTAIQQNVSMMLSGAVVFSSELFNNSYELDLNVLLSLQSAIIDIQTAYNACLLFDNRTLLVPTVAALQANLTVLANIAANSTADQYCLGPLNYNLTMLVSMASNLQVDIFNYSYEIASWIITDFEAALAMEQANYAACLLFDNRTLLETELTGDLANLTAFYNLVMSSTADPYCLTAIQQNLTILNNFAHALQSGLYNYSYSTDAAILAEVDATFAQLQIAYIACLNFDNRTLLVPTVINVLANLSTLGDLAMNSTADPYCLDPIKQNLSILVGASASLQIDIFNYTYDIAATIIADIQASIAMEQAAYDACLLFDNRTLLQAEVSADSASLNAFANILMTSTANPYCLGPIQLDLSNLLTLQLAIESGLFNSSYAADLALMINFDVSFTQLQAAYNACLVFDNRTLLVPTINSLLADLTNLAAIVANSTADPICLSPIQANLTILSTISASLPTDIFNYTYDIGQTVISELQTSLAQAQAAFIACQTFDSRTLLMPNVTANLAALNALSSLIMNSTADSSCLSSIQQNLSMIMNASQLLPTMIFSFTYDIDVSMITTLTASIADLQAAFNACLNFDNRTTLVPTITTAITDINSLLASIPSNSSLACMAELQQNLTILLSTSTSLQVDIFNYTYDISASIVLDLQQSIANAQAQLTACQNYDPRSAFFAVSSAAVSNLSAIAADILNIPSTSPCLSAVQQAMALLNNASISFNQSILVATYNTSVANAASLTQAILDLQAAEAACKNYDNRTEFMGSNLILASNVSDLMNIISSSNAASACVNPILQDAVWLLGNITAFNGTVLSNSYSTDLVTSNSLYATFSAIQAQWSACLVYTTTTNTTTDPRIALNSTLASATATLNDLLAQIQNFTGNQTGIPGFTTAINDLLNQIQALEANMMNNNYTTDAALVNAIQSAVAQQVADWAAYVTNSSATTSTTIDPRLALLTEAQNLATILAGLTQEMQNYAGDQAGISTFLGLTSDLTTQIQNLIANMMSNTYAVDASLLAAIQDGIAQDAAAWATYKASDTAPTSAATSTGDLTTTAQALLADLNALLQSMQSFTGNQTGVPGFVSDTTGLITMLEALIANMGSNTLVDGIAALTALQNAAAQEATAWAAYVAGSSLNTTTTATTTTTTVDPRLALIAEAQLLLTNLSALTQDIQAFTGDQSGIATFLGLTGDITTQVQNFINNIMNNDFTTDAALLSNLQNFVAQDTAAWTAYKDSNTASTAAATSTADLTTIAQTLLSDLNELLANMLNYAGNQTGVTGFVDDTSNLITQLENLIASFGTNGLPADISALTALQSQIAQEATAWAAYVAGDVSGLSTITTTTTTADPRLALLDAAQGLQTVLDVLMQDMQNYTGSQAGVSTFLGLTADLITQIQNLIANMMNNTYAVDAGLLATIQDSIVQDAAAWAAFKASDTAPTSAATSTADLTTTAQALLADLNALLQSMQSYTGNQTGVPEFVSDTTGLISMLQDLITNMGINSLASDISALTIIQNAAAQDATAWAAYVAGSTLSTNTTTTTVDPRVDMTTAAQQLLAELQTLLQTIQNYSGNQTGVPGFISDTSSLISQVQDLIANMMNNPASVDATSLSDLTTLVTQEATAWAQYVANDVTTTTVDPRLALLTEAQNLATIIAGLTQEMQNYAGDQAGISTFLGLTSDLTTQIQNLIANMMSNTYAVDASLLAAIQDGIAQDAAAWATYKASDTTPTIAATSTGDLTTTAQALLADLNALLQSMQSYTGNQTAVPGFVSDTTGLITMLEALIANMGSNTLVDGIAALTALQNAAAQEATAWAAYVAGSSLNTTTTATTTTTTVDPRLALIAEAQLLLTNLSALTQDIQAFTGDQSGITTFLGLTGDITTQVQNFINNIMNNDFTTDAALLSNLQNFVAQDTAAWTAYKDSNTASTAAATSTADLTTIAQTLLSDLNELLASMLNYAGNQTGVTGFVDDTSNLITQLENLIASFGTNGLTADISALTALQSQIAQEATAWAAYVAGDVSGLSTITTTTTTADPRLALLDAAQGLQTVLDVLMQDMQNYTGSQAGVQTFLGLTADLIAQIQNLIANMMNNTYAVDAGLLATIQDSIVQDAAAWATYKASDTAPTSAATSTGDLTTTAQALFADLNALLQSMQSYTGNQTGVPEFVSDTTGLITMLQDLIANMGSNSLASDITALTIIQNAAAQDATAWAAYVAGSTLSTNTTTTTVDPRIDMITAAQQLLAELQTLLQTIQNYSGNQTGVPGFVSDISTLISQVQDLIANMMNNPASVDATSLSDLTTLATQEATAWAQYVASDVTSSTTTTTVSIASTNSTDTTLASTDTTQVQNTTTVDPRLALLSTSQILQSNLAALAQDMQSYTGNQAGVPTFTTLTGQLSSSVGDLINNIMINNYSTDAAQLNNLQLLSSQDAAAWIAYKSTDTNATAAATSTSALNTTVESTISDLNMLLQSMQNYAANQADVPASVSDTISNIQNLITQSQSLSENLGANSLAVDIANVTALQSQVAQAATGWAAYIANILSASTATTASSATASITTAISQSNSTTIAPSSPSSTDSTTTASIASTISQSNSTTPAPSSTDTTAVISNATTLAPVASNTSDTTTVSLNTTTLAPTVDNATTTTTTQTLANVTTTTLPVTTIPTTAIPTTAVPTTEIPTTLAPTTLPPTTLAPTTLAPTTLAPTTLAPTTLAPTTLAPTTLAPTTLAPTTLAPTTMAPTTTTTTVITTTTSKTYPLTTIAGQCDWCFKIPLLSWAQLLISFKSTNCGCPSGYVVMRNWTDLIFGKEHSCCY